jgi:putative transposase
MRKSKFSEHQIIVIDPESLEAGRNVKDVCREHEISDAQLTTSGSRCTLAWQASDIKRLRELEEETRPLKQISG